MFGSSTVCVRAWSSDVYRPHRRDPECVGSEREESANIMKITVNLNDRVRVRLTGRGKRVLAELGYPVKIDLDGTTTLQLHELCHLFGPFMFMGNSDRVIENTIELL